MEGEEEKECEVEVRIADRPKCRGPRLSGFSGSVDLCRKALVQKSSCGRSSSAYFCHQTFDKMLLNTVLNGGCSGQDDG